MTRHMMLRRDIAQAHRAACDRVGEATLRAARWRWPWPIPRALAIALAVAQARRDALHDVLEGGREAEENSQGQVLTRSEERR